MPFTKYSPKQKKIARVAKPRNKITGADFKKLKQKKRARNVKRQSKDASQESSSKATQSL